MTDGINVVLEMEVIGRPGRVIIENESVTFGKISSCQSQMKRNEAQCTVAVEDVGTEERVTRMTGAEGREERLISASLKTDPCMLVDQDFVAQFNGMKWGVQWILKGEELSLKSKVGCYSNSMTELVKREFGKVEERWINEGILVPLRSRGRRCTAIDDSGPANKGKVRPVLNFRELNTYVMSHTGDDGTDVCCETLRMWR